MVNVHPIKFEDIIKQTPATLDKISQILGNKAKYTEPLLPKSIRSLWHSRWVSLTQIKPDSTAIIGYYKGQNQLSGKQPLAKAIIISLKLKQGNYFKN